MIKRIGYMIAVCCIPWASMAQQWQAVGGRGNAVEVDRASVIKVDKGFQVWSRVTEPQQILGPEEGFFYRRLLQLNEYRCEDRMYAPLQRLYFNEAGLLVKDQRFPNPDPDELQRVVPGTNEDRLYQTVCRNVKEERPATARASTPPENRVRNEVRNRNASAGSPSTPPSVTASTDRSAPRSTATTTSSSTPETTVKVVDARKSGIVDFLSQMIPGKEEKKTTVPPAIAPVKPPVTIGQAPTVAPTAIPAKTEAAPVSPPTPKPAAAPKPVTPPAQAVKKEQPAKQEIPKVAVENRADKRPTDKLPWLYEADSPKGPRNWSRLNANYALCSTGLYQAPINIQSPVTANMEPIQFTYKPLPLKVIDTGTTIRVNADVGASITWQGIRYDLLYYTFHSPSEIRVEGKAYDMSIHLIHRSPQGKVTVLVVPVKVGKENLMVRRLWDNLPLEMGIELAPRSVVLNPEGFLPVTADPKRLGYYAFVGSLSTPPCTEGVLWLVLKQPLEASAQQINDFKKIYQGNIRPLQPLRGRLIKATTY